MIEKSGVLLFILVFIMLYDRSFVMNFYILVLSLLSYTIICRSNQYHTFYRYNQRWWWNV